MDLILCHQTADFDALGAAVGLTKLYPGAKIVLTGGAHPSVKDFLALHRDELNLIEKRSVNPKQICSLIVVDTQQSDRLGKAAEWLKLPHLLSIHLYDHHPEGDGNIPATMKKIEMVGATTTIVTEMLQKKNISLPPVEATAMALGIHVDTGSLTFEQSTPRDAYAIAWLMTQKANVRSIAEYVEPSLSPQLQEILQEALANLKTEQISGYNIGTVLIETKDFVPGLSNLTEKLRDLTETDVFIFAHYYQLNELSADKTGRLTVIGRSRLEDVNLQEIFANFSGGGHSNAASFTKRCHGNPYQVLKQVFSQLKQQIPQPLTARDLMSSPVRTIRPSTTIKEAQRILLRYGHSGLFVVNDEDELTGVISRRDLDLALHHGFSHAPVKGYMTKNLKTITPNTLLPEIESLMVNNDIGRLPVLESKELLGIVTRTDVLRLIHETRMNSHQNQQDKKNPLTSCLLPNLKNSLHQPIWEILEQAASHAYKKGWHLYLVGGGVRDLLLADSEDGLKLQDIDLVVDGFHKAAVTGAGVELAKELTKLYPGARLSVHGDFQTAALLWHKDENVGSLWIDIATARTEFYPYPAANPEVEASSIRQDLYRRDFTINALAVRLTPPRAGELLDFFEGLNDLRSHQIRVLHANSFIEDPTRIYRAVRFAVRLNFEIEAQTEEYIRYAISSRVYERVSRQKNAIPALRNRLKSELSYILQAPYWKRALTILSDLGALHCIHPDLVINKELWWQIRCLNRWLRFYDPNRHYSHWLIRLEIIIAAIPDVERVKVAKNLELPKDSIERLRDIKTIETEIEVQLPLCTKISEIVQLLRKYDAIALILVAVRSEKSIRRTLWKYLMHWSKLKSPLNGHDLKQLGYKQGKQYKQMLNDLHSLFLDGKIKDKQEAEKFILKKYPLSAKDNF